jgi:hypothetical protein
MESGSIVESARRDGRDMVMISGGLMVICLIVLALNWKFTINFAAGPATFDGALSASPGVWELVEVDGEFVDTGGKQTDTFSIGSAEINS